MPLDLQTMATTLQPGRISPTRQVPADIPRPEYVGKKRPWTGEPDVKDPETIERMRAAGRLAAQALAEVGRHVAPGVTTDELDRVGHEFLTDHGAYPSTLGYRGYPKSLCTSLNEVICHGIPDDTVIADGDIVNVDITAYLNGVHGDTNATFLAGNVDEESRLLGGARLHRPRDRDHLPLRADRAALRRPQRQRDHGARDDLHHRADADPGHDRVRPVAGRVDGGDPGPQARGPVRAHRAGHRGRPRDPDLPLGHVLVAPWARALRPGPPPCPHDEGEADQRDPARELPGRPRQRELRLARRGHARQVRREQVRARIHRVPAGYRH